MVISMQPVGFVKIGFYVSPKYLCDFATLVFFVVT